MLVCLTSLADQRKVDGIASENVLAKRLNQSVTLLSVVEGRADLNPLVSTYDAVISYLIKQRCDFTQSYLDGVRTRLQAQGLSVTAEVARRVVTATIIASAASHQAGLIAMAAHCRAGPERWFLGVSPTRSCGPRPSLYCWSGLMTKPLQGQPR